MLLHPRHFYHLLVALHQLGAGGEEGARAGGEEVEGALGEEVEGALGEEVEGALGEEVEGRYVNYNYFLYISNRWPTGSGGRGHLVDPSGAEAPEEEGTVMYSTTLAY